MEIITFTLADWEQFKEEISIVTNGAWNKNLVAFEIKKIEDKKLTDNKKHH